MIVMRKCKTPYCRRNCRKGGKDCNTCHSRKVRAANPIKAGYRGLKSNAKRRRIHFDLPYAAYEKLVLDSGYIKGKGTLKDSLQIDRICNDFGYVEGNLRVITSAQNRAAYVQYLKDRQQVEEPEGIITGDPDNIPF